MTILADKIAGFWRDVASLLGLGADRAPIDSVARLEEFVATRAAYLAQKTLYGYVKTRMGTRYVAMFENDAMRASLNIAKVHVFAACLSDLTVYAVARSLETEDAAARQALAQRCYAAGLEKNRNAAPEQFSATDAIEEFGRRLAQIDWGDAREPEIFTLSPKALMKWAPIADNLKRLDREVVENSVKFAWRAIREQFQKRIDAAAVSADWSRQPAA